MEIKRKLILTVGVSNSGKTFWVNSLCKAGLVNINRDDIRASDYTPSGRIQDYNFTKQKEKGVTETQFKLANHASMKGYMIVVSDTNLNPKTRENWKQWASKNNYEYEEKVFDVEPHICIARSLKRDYTIPPHVINKQYIQMREYLGLPTTYEFDDNLPTCVIVDIDGTVADMTGVRHPFEWDKVGLDEPHKDIIDLVFELSYDYDIMFLSGRDGCCYDATYEWIEDHVALGEEPIRLFMREVDDNRADSIVKEELFDKHIRGRYNVKYVLDDRQQVCSRWRSMGLRVLQVAEGAF
jgi:predicted kinase